MAGAAITDRDLKVHANRLMVGSQIGQCCQAARHNGSIWRASIGTAVAEDRTM
jgi:hypothetical protein